MHSQFLPVAASIHVDVVPPLRSLQAFYDPQAQLADGSRVLFHEVFHFWQYLNSGYLMRLVEEDRQRLARFETTGEPQAEAPRRRDYVTPDRQHGISPRDLVEVAARFWDVQVVNPVRLLALEVEAGEASAPILERHEALRHAGLLEPRPDGSGYRWEAFELAMEGPGGGWAEPYLALRRRCSVRAASIFFPMAASVSLQTRDPVATYMFLMSGASDFETVFAAAQSPQQLWRWAHDVLLDLAHQLGPECLLGSGIKVAGEGPLAEEPLWKWLVGYALRAAAEIAGHHTPGLAWEEAVPRGIGELSFLLGCAGTSASRSFLVPLLLPPRVTYTDGSSWCPAKDAAQSMGVPPQELAVFDQVEQVSADLAARWARFRSASSRGV
jgi:hypothetical protein